MDAKSSLRMSIAAEVYAKAVSVSDTPDERKEKAFDSCTAADVFMEVWEAEHEDD